MTTDFRIGVSRDIRASDGSSVYPLDDLDRAPDVTWEFLAEDVPELSSALIAGYDAVIVEHPRITAATVGGPQPPILLARTGVGVDSVDVDACTAAGALVSITPDAVRRPMATAAMAFLLALTHRIPQRDRLVRGRRWDIFAYIGRGLTGRTLGVLGLGNIGRELCSLAAPFDMRRIGCDPFVQEIDGVELVDLDRLLAESDFLCVTAPLTDQTRHLLNRDRLSLMRPEAFVVNISRGPIIEQGALTDALREGRLAGAALDVFEKEPIAPDDPLLELDNVILAPHGIGMSDEILLNTGRSACNSVLAVAAGRVPANLLNPTALDHPRLAGRLQA